MAKHKKNSNNFLPILIILPILAIGVSSYAVLRGVRGYISTSSYFKLVELKVEGITDSRYVDVMKEEILGTNIFRIDTRKLSDRIRNRFPTFYSVIVTRELPSTLSIVAKERIPVAVVRGDYYYLFDNEGVIISRFSLSEQVDFPLLIGLDNRLKVLKLGETYELPVLMDVLDLARVLRQHRFNINLSMPGDLRLKITKIDATDEDDFSFYLGDTTQVRMGHKNFENKVRLLSAILKSLSNEIVNVKYIDLRPKEPVISMKKEASK